MGLSGKLVAFVALLAGLYAMYWKIDHRGEQRGRAEIQAKWDIDNAERLRADNAAILNRVKNNERAAEQDAINNQRITKARNDEIAQIRADYDRAPGLRISANVCSGFAGASKTESAGGGDGTAASTRLLPDAVDRDIKALMLEVETVAATLRAAQDFIVSNGMGF